MIIKINYFFIYISYFFFVININAQTNTPIIGYDKLEWGATIDVFQRTYPTAREITSEEYSFGKRLFKQINIGSGITSRIFEFLNNRLFSVTVKYEELDNNSTLALTEKIVEIYGRFDRKYEQTSPADDNSTIHMTRFFIDYRNNLQIITAFVEYYNQFNRIIKNNVFIVYINPITREEVNAAERKHRSRELGL